MGHIFISYSHKDSSYVHKLVRALEEEGFEVWIDDRIHYGSEWPKVVTRNLDASDGVIIVMSNNSFESDMVQNEITRARDEKKPIFPLLLDGKNWLIVQAKQFVDVKDGSLPTEKFYKRLEEITSRKNEKAEREAAEKAEREMAERNTSEKAAREKEKRDAAEAKREGAERQTVRKAVLVKASSNFLITLKSTLSKAKPILRVIGIIGIVVVLFWVGSWGISQLASLVPTAKASLTPTFRPSATATYTITPLLPTKVFTPTKTPFVFPDTTPTLTSGSRPATYTMQNGEFLYCIARRFDVDPDQLIKLNGLSDGVLYPTPMLIKIPQTGVFPGNRVLTNHPTIYTVRSSDETINGIACIFGDVYPEDIALLNGLPLNVKLKFGQALQIP